MEVAPPKFFRLSIGNEVRLKNGYIIKGESVTKNSDGIITEIQVSYDEDSRSGSGSEASQRKVAGTLHWVSIGHAVPVEVRLYDRLFIDEAPDSHKEKNFLDFMNPNSLQTITAYVEPSLLNARIGDQFQFQRLGYFAVDKDTISAKLVFNKTVGLKDAWEEKGKKDTNSINNSLKDINKFFKVTSAEERLVISESIGQTLKEIINYSLLLNSFKKNINNNKSSLLFANYILKYSSLQFLDFDKDELSKLFMMSLRSESTFVRSTAILNLVELGYEGSFVSSFKDELLKLQSNSPKSTTDVEKEIIEKLLNQF
jgi:glutaminyl-tRNA synthetase